MGEAVYSIEILSVSSGNTLKRFAQVADLSSEELGPRCLFPKVTCKTMDEAFCWMDGTTIHILCGAETHHYSLNSVGVKVTREE